MPGSTDTHASPSVPPSLICFDLGGVIVDLGGVTSLAKLGRIDPAEFLRRWLVDPFVRDFERGAIDVDAFASGIVAAWPFPASREEFLEVFSQWPRGLFEGAEDLLVALRGRARLACLSNTNAIHWARQGPEWGLDRLFDVRLLSFETGRVKPDLDTYEHARTTFAVPAREILFLDDNMINVIGARDAGWQAEHVRGLPEVRAALARHGFGS
jgi:glucose-1-phosphatase